MVIPCVFLATFRKLNLFQNERILKKEEIEAQRGQSVPGYAELGHELKANQAQDPNPPVGALAL